VLRVPNGKLFDSPIIARFIREVCQECVDVACSEGIQLSSASMYARVRVVARDTSRNLCSMLQDVERENRTEIGQINGAFCRIGKDKGTPTPLNNALVAMVGSLEDLKRQQKG
jgi:2-dehydropantoate 2-reductase